MKKFYSITAVLFFLNIVRAQNKLRGTVSSEYGGLDAVELINTTQKLSVISNSAGYFEIKAENKDVLLVYKKGYIVKQHVISSDDYSGKFSVFLSKEPIIMDEIAIVKIPQIKFDMSYAALKKAEIEKQQSRPQVVGVYTGQIQNGVDLVAIGGEVFKQVKKLFKKDRIQIPPVDFSVLAKSKMPTKFWVNDLKLAPTEIELFLDFCKKDNQIKKFTQQTNMLEIIEFLLLKRSEFKS